MNPENGYCDPDKASRKEQCKRINVIKYRICNKCNIVNNIVIINVINIEYVKNKEKNNVTYVKDTTQASVYSGLRVTVKK